MYIFIYIYIYIYAPTAVQMKPSASLQKSCGCACHVCARSSAVARLTGQHMITTAPAGIRRHQTCDFRVPLLRLQSSEGKFTMSMSREIEPVRRSFCRRRHVYGSGTFGAVGANSKIRGGCHRQHHR